MLAFPAPSPYRKYSGMEGVDNVSISLFFLLKYLKIILNASGISFSNLLSKILSTMGFTEWHSSIPFIDSHTSFPIVPHPRAPCIPAKPQL